jgi:adenylate cyclase
LEGSVRWQGSLVKITAQLNGTANGYHLWSHTYEGDARDVFQIQEQVAQQIADALNRQLRKSDLPRPGTENLEARNLYLEGLHLRNTTEPKRIGQAILNFQRASQLDHDYAAPQAGLAVCYVMLAWGGVMPPQEAYRLAETASKEALKRDDNLSTAHTSNGIVELVFDWDWPRAAQEFQRALDLNPSDAEAHHWHSHYLVVVNRIDDSLKESRRALDLDPLNFLISAHLGWHYLQAPA